MTAAHFISYGELLSTNVYELVVRGGHHGAAAPQCCLFHSKYFPSAARFTRALLVSAFSRYWFFRDRYYINSGELLTPTGRVTFLGSTLRSQRAFGR